MLWIILALLLALTLWGAIRFYKRSMRAHRAASDVVIELNKLAADPDQDSIIAIETLLVAETLNPGEYAEAAACARDTLERLADFDPNDDLDSLLGPCWEGLIIAAILWASISARLPAAAALLLAESLGATAQDVRAAKVALADEQTARRMVAVAQKTMGRLNPEGD